LRGAARSFTALQSRHGQELESKPIRVVKAAETSDRKDFVCAIWNLQQSRTGVMETTPTKGKGSGARKERVGPRRGRQLSVSPRWQEIAGMYRG
jgi:hypothetical protein